MAISSSGFEVGFSDAWKVCLADWRLGAYDDSPQAEEGPHRMTPASDKASFGDARQNLREHLNRIRSTGRPLYVTSNGETEAIVLSPSVFDELLAKAELADSLAGIERGLADVRADRTQAYRESIREIAQEIGLTIGP